MNFRPLVLLTLAGVLCLGGCAEQEAKSDQQVKSNWGPPRDVTGSGEMKPGRGLLTGESGEWVIFAQQ